MKNTSHSLDIHNNRVTFLDSLAVLSGCSESIGSSFPDGCHPDVARVNSSERFLFIGDAKNTEGPGNLATRVRLLCYLHWFIVHARAGGDGVFAVCMGYDADIRGWVEAIKTLVNDTPCQCLNWRVDRFPPDFVVILFGLDPVRS